MEAETRPGSDGGPKKCVCGGEISEQPEEHLLPGMKPTRLALHLN